MSLLAAFAAMLGKQWLNRYSGHAGGSMIERCGDRQRKFDGLQWWPFHFIIGSLPVMLQIALLLLACGLCRFLFTINKPVAYTLIALTGLGVLFYLVVVIVGASSYDCPFQTPGSAQLRSLGKKVRPIILPVIAIMRTLGRTIQRGISVVWLSLVKVYHHFLTLLERVQIGILRMGFCLPPLGLNINRRFRKPPLPTTQEGPHTPDPHDLPPWFAPNELAIIQKKNTDNVRCVSWILDDITDPEALDVAIQLAGSIRWFDDEINVKPLYDLIISTFDICFGSNGVVHPGSRNRAYYSGLAILWIHTLAVCESEDVAPTFLLPTRHYQASSSDHELQQVVSAFQSASLPESLMYGTRRLEEYKLPHSRWISNVLLHLTWATQTRPSFHSPSLQAILLGVNASTPYDVLFNLLLACCNSLGSPVEKDVLKIQDKSYDISDPCSPSYLYHCSLVIAWTRSSDK